MNGGIHVVHILMQARKVDLDIRSKTLRHWEQMFSWSILCSRAPKIISKQILNLVKTYSLRKIPTCNEEHEWKYQHHDQDSCSHGGANKECKHSTLQWLEEIHGPQAEDVYGKPKERKKVGAIETNKEKREFDDIHISLSEALEILSKKGYLKPLEPTLLPNPIPRTWNMNDYCAFTKSYDTRQIIALGWSTRFKIWLMVGWSLSQDSRDEARLDEGMCLRDSIHENTFARGWDISIMLSPFQLSSLHFLSNLLESFSMLCCWVLFCHVESSFVTLSRVPLNF